MMKIPVQDKQDVFGLLNQISGPQSQEALKELVWSRLGYDRVNSAISRKDWNEATKSVLSEDPVLFAAGGDDAAFHIITARLASDRLRATDERLVITRLLRDHPYALFIFSNAQQTHWHFVNVRAAGDKSDTDAQRDPLRRRMFRRITIGPEERLRTAAERIALLDMEKMQPDLFGLSPLQIQAQHDEAFDVEVVTRDFYTKYKALFNILQDDLAKQTKDKVWAHDYVLQFLNRLMFIYFIQRKRWLNDDPDFLKNFWDAYKKGQQPADSFAKRWLSVLFFEVFNNRTPNAYNYFPETMRTALQMAPWLNGGLFSRNDLDEKFAGKFTLADKRFEQAINFLEQYNFTVSEDTPLDQEVAVDAEMLGKVYESLVNVSEEADERGDAGIFYTPRTEIDMMCRLAVVDYLANHLDAGHKPLLYKTVFAFTPEEKTEADEQLSNHNLWGELDRLLQGITVVDPACGSGSFLIGMLQVLDDLVQRADAVLGRLESPYERRKRIIGQSLYGVDVMRWAVDVAELRLWLQLVIETEILPGELKLRPLLPNLTFKIRRGDSLVQEIGGIDMAHRKGSPVIPSALKGRLTKLKGEKLKFYNNDIQAKFQSQSEIEQEERRLFQDIFEARKLELENRLQDANRALETDTDLYGDTVSRMDEKSRMTTEAEKDAIAAELVQAQTALDALARTKETPFVWDIAFVEIFTGDSKGFDIVIGNPPYVRQESISDPMLAREKVTTAGKKQYKEKLIRSVYRLWPMFFGANPEKPNYKINAKSDLYIYFFFHGLWLLNDKGSFCFITSNSWLDVGYGKDLQEFLLKHGHVKLLVDNQAKRSFASADVNTAIALLGPPARRPAELAGKIARFVLFKAPFEQALTPNVFADIDAAAERTSTPEYRMFPIDQKTLFEQGCDAPEEEDEDAAPKTGKTRGPLIKVAKYIGNKWGGKYLRAPDIYWTILEKGKGKLVRLGDIAEVRFGIKTGANEFFYLDKEKIEEWGIEPEFLKPVIKSPRECKRILVDPKDLKMKIFMCHKDKKELKGTAALEYIKWGEKQGFHERPSCAGRLLWWDVGTRQKAQINANYLVNDVMRFIAVEKGFFVSDNFQEVHIPKRLFWQTSISCNSTILQLFANMMGRSNFGGGLMKIQTYEVESLPLIAPEMLNEKKCREVLMTTERVDLRGEDRKKMDEVIFDVLSLKNVEREEVYATVYDLVDSRLEKADSLK